MESRSLPTQAGFTIATPLELLNWETIPLDASLPLETQTHCPACALEFGAIARLEAKDGSMAIRIGSCPSCGCVGYQDRPTRAWISRYYAEIWTHGAEKDIEALRAKRQKDNPAARTIAKALEMLARQSFGNQKLGGRPIVEIGSGYGTMLKFIRERGFSNLIGLESSHHRAQAAHAAAIPMLTGDFESGAVQAELRRRAPVGLIYAFHVLEHTYNPADIIASAGRLQGVGDLLVLGVPNAWGEPAMNILLFLPHLHSFTEESLGMLLARHGYRIIDKQNSSAAELNIIAEKTGTAAPLPPPAPDPLGRLKQKFRHELVLDTPLTPGKRYRYFWSKKDAAVSGILPYRWYWRMQDRLARRSGIRSLQVKSLDTAAAENTTPFRIQFANDLFLCIK